MMMYRKTSFYGDGMAEQRKRKIGETREYPGSYAWPINEVFCPVCKKWVGEYGNIDQKDTDGDWHMVCVPCGEVIDKEVFANQPV